MAAPDWVADAVALVVELLWVLVLEETVEGAERVLTLEGEVGVVVGRVDVVSFDVKVLAMTVEVGTDPVLEPPVEVELAAEVEDPTMVEVPVELPPIVEDPATVEPPVELPEPELPVIPSRLKVPDQPW